MKILDRSSVIFETLLAVRFSLQIVIALIVCAFSAPEAKAADTPSLAILYFDNNTGDKSLDVLSRGFADMLITDLSESKQVTVVEREKLQSLLDEISLQKSRYFDNKTAIKLGKGLGARYVVSGAFASVAPNMRIDVRMIEVASGKVILATKVVGPSAQVFELEQKLAGQFLKRLNLKFFEEDLPSTKVPSLEALVAYSEGLSLKDKGEMERAAAKMKLVVKMAPAFGLARMRHAAIVARMTQARGQRTAVIKKGRATLLAHANNYLTSHSFEKLSEDEAEYFIGYRVLVGREILEHLRGALRGRSDTSRLIPRKGAPRAIKLIHAFYNNQRSLIAEDKSFRSRFTSSPSNLPDADEKLASELRMKYRDSNPQLTMLRFLFHGRASANSGSSYRILPAPSDIDKKLKRAALKLANGMLKQGATDARNVADVQTELATWRIDRGEIEKGIGHYQAILDRFPTHHRFDRIELLIKQQLGLKHNFEIDRRKTYRLGLKTCDSWKVHVGHSNVISQRVRYLGLQALPQTLKEVEKVCKGSPNLPKMKKSLYKSFMLASARYEDCEWFDRYMKLWLAQGGSVTDSKGYRKNYSDCP